jgi:hypothetical protein
MIKHVQDTIVADAKESVRKLFDTFMDSPHRKEEVIELAMETIEVTILNSFWKHGISSSVIRTERGENI